MKFAICNEIFNGKPIHEVFEYAKNVGYDAVEIAPFTINESVELISSVERKKIRSSAEKHNISISGIHWLLVKPPGLHITHSDPSIRNKTSQYLTRLVDFCADIGGQFMVLGSPKQRNIPEDSTINDATARAIEVLSEPVKQAEKRGVVICLEPLGPSETNFINTAAEAIAFVKKFNSESFKIILDVKAMCTENKPIPQIIKESWPWFAYFHANDSNLKGPGFGNVDFYPIAKALKDVGYNGFVSVEVFKFEDGFETIANKSIQYLKKVFAA